MVKKKQKWEVYIIQATSGKLYTGITTDLQRRFTSHLNQQKGARFFRFADPEKIVFQENYLTRSEATKREIQIKKLNRKQKLELIASYSEITS